MRGWECWVGFEEVVVVVCGLEVVVGVQGDGVLSGGDGVLKWGWLGVLKCWLGVIKWWWGLYFVVMVWFVV